MFFKFVDGVEYFLSSLLLIDVGFYELYSLVYCSILESNCFLIYKLVIFGVILVNVQRYKFYLQINFFLGEIFEFCLFF